MDLGVSKYFGFTNKNIVGTRDRARQRTTYRQACVHWWRICGRRESEQSILSTIKYRIIWRAIVAQYPELTRHMEKVECCVMVQFLNSSLCPIGCIFVTCKSCRVVACISYDISVTVLVIFEFILFFYLFSMAVLSHVYLLVSLYLLL